MSSKDKTRQKLMDSMRKTKAGSTKKDQEVDKKTKTKPQDNKPVKNKTKKPTKAKMSTDTQKLSIDPYQTTRRVWPD